jgi:hypothetical protein
VNEAPTAPSLDGREFVMTSSTNSPVDPASPSRFHYSERDGVIWGDYVGDTFGRFVGTRTGDVLQVSFVHQLLDGGTVVSGTGGSRVELDGRGRRRLVEEFEIDGDDHISICVEV